MTIHKKTVEARWYLGCNKAISLVDIVKLQPYVPLKRLDDILEQFEVLRNHVR